MDGNQHEYVACYGDWSRAESSGKNLNGHGLLDRTVPERQNHKAERRTALQQESLERSPHGLLDFSIE